MTVIPHAPAGRRGPRDCAATVAIGSDETAASWSPVWPNSARHSCSGPIDASWRPDGGRAIDRDPALATRAPRLRKEQGPDRLVAQRAGRVRWARALQPWPKTYTFWHRPRRCRPLRLIFRAHCASSRRPFPVGAGTVLEAAGGKLVVATGA